MKIFAISDKKIQSAKWQRTINILPKKDIDGFSPIKKHLPLKKLSYKLKPPPFGAGVLQFSKTTKLFLAFLPLAKKLYLSLSQYYSL